MIILTTLLLISFVGSIAGPSYKKVPTLTMEFQNRALANSFSHSELMIGANEAIQEELQQDAISYMASIETELEKMNLLQ